MNVGMVMCASLAPACHVVLATATCSYHMIDIDNLLLESHIAALAVHVVRM